MPAIYMADTITEESLFDLEVRLYQAKTDEVAVMRAVRFLAQEIGMGATSPHVGVLNFSSVFLEWFVDEKLLTVVFTQDCDLMQVSITNGGDRYRSTWKWKPAVHENKNITCPAGQEAVR
jgi:hypothetical protein